MQIVQELQSHGYRVRKQGRTWGSSHCPRCGEGGEHSNKFCAFTGKDGKERWFCHACGERGDLADLISALEGVPLKEALRRTGQLRESQPGRQAHQQASKRYYGSASEVSTDVDLGLLREVITDLLRGLPMWEPDVGAYLLKRGISKATVVEACHRGIVRMLPANPQHARDLLIRAAKGANRLSAAGLWAGQSDRWPANAFRPLIFFGGGNTTVEFRNIHKDSNYPKSIRMGCLTKPYVWRGDLSRVIVVEGVIDMLSLVEMGEKRTIMALPGVNAWKPEWFRAAHKAYGSRFTIALDDDKAGNLVAEAILSCLQDSGIEGERLVPAEGKDWNDLLVLKAQALV